VSGPERCRRNSKSWTGSIQLVNLKSSEPSWKEKLSGVDYWSVRICVHICVCTGMSVCVCVYVSTPCPKKGATKLMVVTSSNLNHFSKFFYNWKEKRNLQWVCWHPFLGHGVYGSVYKCTYVRVWQNLSFYFMDCGEIPPPVIQVQNVSFRYKDSTVRTGTVSIQLQMTSFNAFINN